MIQSIHLKSILSLFILVLSLSFSSEANAQSKQSDEKRIYIKIEIKGLACPYCAFGMEKELKEISGVEQVDIELKAGLAYISTPIEQKPTKEKIGRVITDAGFTVGKIEYSDKVFNMKKE